MSEPARRGREEYCLWSFGHHAYFRLDGLCSEMWLITLLTRSGLAEFLNATLFLPMKLNHA